MDNIINKLKYWLKPKEKLFMDFCKFVLDWENPEKNRIFIDRKSDILFIAHIDTVKKPKFYQKTKKRVYASGLDDRLGCMLASELSAELKADLLICDNEEICNSTGQYHDLKSYNWIVEFDRAGNDVVTYNLDCPEFLTELSKYWKIGIGAFSDICLLKTDSCCMNLGIGYQKAHSKDSYVELKVLKQQISKFKDFFAKHKNTKFIQGFRVDRYYDDDDNYSAQQHGECEFCGIMADVDYVFGHIICEDCFEGMCNQYCGLIWK